MIAWSEHAKERAQERFPGIDLESVYYRAQRAGKKTKKKIKACCPQSAKTWMTGGFKGRYYRIKSGIVFVMQPPETVITVFDISNVDKP